MFKQDTEECHTVYACDGEPQNHVAKLEDKFLTVSWNEMYSEMIKEIELALNQSQRLDKISIGSLPEQNLERKFISSRN